MSSKLTERDRTVCVVQARTSSQRVPGKVLADIGTGSVLQTLLRRLRRGLSFREVVVVTSALAEDDGVAAVALSEGVTSVRGSLHDVASRFVRVAAQLQPEAMVRICADSPFADPAFIDGAVELFWRHRPDLVSTSNPRTTPVGLSVEVIAARRFCELYQEFEDPLDKEHVTRFLYRHRERCSVESFIPTAPIPLGCSLAIDTVDDLQRARRVVAHLGGAAVVAASGYDIAAVVQHLGGICGPE